MPHPSQVAPRGYAAPGQICIRLLTRSAHPSARAYRVRLCAARHAPCIRSTSVSPGEANYNWGGHTSDPVILGRWPHRGGGAAGRAPPPVAAEDDVGDLGRGAEHRGRPPSRPRPSARRGDLVGEVAGGEQVRRDHDTCRRPGRHAAAAHRLGGARAAADAYAGSTARQPRRRLPAAPPGRRSRRWRPGSDEPAAASDHRRLVAARASGGADGHPGLPQPPLQGGRSSGCGPSVASRR